MSVVGVTIEQFNIPVCNAFKAKILNDQLCYEVDLKKFSDKNNIQEEIKSGFNFLLDYNEDRQVFEQGIKRKNFGLANSFDESDQNNDAFVYLDTIGKEIQMIKISIFPPGSEYPLYPGLEEAHQPSLAERAVTLVTSNLTVATLPLPLLLLGMFSHHLISTMGG